jgi:PKD repeat protein
MMKNNLVKYSKSLAAVVGISTLIFSCKKDDIVVDFNYPAATVGIAQAAVATVGPGANGVYTITPKIYDQTYRFIGDVATSKFNIPLGIIRSAVDLSGSVSVNVAANTDTVTKMITAAKLPAGTELLPSSAYTLPGSVSIESDAVSGSLTLAVDLNFLIANITKKYAVAVAISASKSDLVNPKLAIAVIYIDPTAVLVPVANFSNSVENAFRKANFVNLSANGISYSWNFGDGSPAETKASPGHTYTSAGTYTISLTTTGITGTPSVKTTNIVIP